MGYKGRRDWGQVGVAALVILRGSWVSPAHAACVWGAPLVVLAIVLAATLVTRT